MLFRSFQTGTTWRATATVRWNTAPTVSTDNFLRISDGGDIVTSGRILSPGYVIPTSVVYGSTPQIIGATDTFSFGEVFGPAGSIVIIPNSAKVGDYLLFVGRIDASGSIGAAEGTPFTVVASSSGGYDGYAYRRVTGPEIGRPITVNPGIAATDGRIFVVRGLDP